MRIVNIIGGLGNQMFQYAFALALKNRFPDEDVYIDTSHFSGYRLHNGFELFSVFPSLSLKSASVSNIRTLTCYVPYYRISRLVRRLLAPQKTEYIQPRNESFTYNPSVFSIQGDCYYEGYWNSAKYIESIRDTILNEFKPYPPNAENLSFIQKISNCNSVGIHVRRGDYVNNRWLAGICDIDYYTRACKMVLSEGSNHHFFIFSDDIAWCKENLAPIMEGSPVHYITHNTGKNSSWDMFLMSYCKELIIANSTFSWWGAFLNRTAKKVIAPSPWINREDNSLDIYCDKWTIINSER